MGALLSFLGGSAFRMVWGEVSSYFSKRQDHKLELERMKLQGDLDDRQHTRNLAAIRQQAELGIKTINVQAEADVSREDAAAWRAAQERMFQPTGVTWVDAWNGVIRPAFASVALVLWLVYEIQHMSVTGWVISAFSMDLVAVIVGFYYADRSLAKRGK